MARYLYVATINCKKGNNNDYKNLEFEADEKNFEKTSDIKKLNQIALRFAKNQNVGETTNYDKVEIQGYSKRGKVSGNSYRSGNNSSKYNLSDRSLFSYNIFLIPFVLAWRIIKFAIIILKM